MADRARARGSPSAEPSTPPRSASGSARRRAGLEEREHQRRQQRDALLAVGAEQRDRAVEEADLARRSPRACATRAAAASRRAGRGHERGRGPGAELLARSDRRAPDGSRSARRPRAARRRARPARSRGARAAARARPSPATRRRRRGSGHGGSAARRRRHPGLAADEQVALARAVARLLELGAGQPLGQRVHRSGRERVAGDGAEGERRALAWRRGGQGARRAARGAPAGAPRPTGRSPK